MEMKYATPEGKKASIEESTALFAKYANDNGLLDLERFQAFAKEHHEMRIARDEPDTEQTPEKNAAWYAVINKINPSTDGIALAEI